MVPIVVGSKRTYKDTVSAKDESLVEEVARIVSGADLWETTIIHHSCGVHYWLLGTSSMLGHVGQLEMVGVSPWHLALGYLTHLVS